MGWIDMHRTWLKLLLAVLCAVCAAPVYAQTAEHESASGHESTHGSHRNLFALFAGINHAGRRENAVSLGVGYERSLNESFGIGLLVEHAFGDADFTVYAVPFTYRVDRWKFMVAPGIEDSEHHGTESLVRFAAEYAFERGSWEMSPQFAVDFVDGEEVYIFGVVFGKGF